MLDDGNKVDTHKERNLQKKFKLKTRFTFLKTGETESFNSAFILNNAIVM